MDEFIATPTPTTDMTSSPTTTTSGRFVPPCYMFTYISVCCLVALLGLVTNTFMFYVITRVRSLHKATNFLLLSLTTSDLLVCGVCIPVYVERFYNQSSEPNKTLCLLRKFLFMLTSSASLWSLAVVSLDRMFAVTYPFFHRRHAHTRLVVGVVVVEWLWCFALSSINFFYLDEWKEILCPCAVGMPEEPYYMVTVPGFYLPGFVIFAAYVKIFLISRKHHKNISVQKMSVCQQPSYTGSAASLNTSLYPTNDILRKPRAYSDTHHEKSSLIVHHSPTLHVSTEVLQPCQQERKPRSTTVDSVRSALAEGARKIRSTTHQVGHEMALDLKAAKTVGVMCGLCVICWVPTALFNAYLNNLNKKRDTVDPNMGVLAYLYDIFLLLGFANSLVNPLLFTFLTKDIKRHSKKIIRSWFRNEDSL